MEESITDKIVIEKELDAEFLKDIKTLPQLKKKAEELALKDISALLKALLFGAITLNSSDLHLESTEQGSMLRMRVDGVLQEVTLFDKQREQRLVSRIKLLSGLKLNVEDKPQDGRFSIMIESETEEAIEVGPPLFRPNMEKRSSCVF